jgi:hypothetical protein
LALELFVYNLMSATFITDPQNKIKLVARQCRSQENKRQKPLIRVIREPVFSVQV